MESSLDSGLLKTDSEDVVLVDGPSTKYVKMNVGGCFFQTTLGTLRKYDCMLRAMFSGRMTVRQDSDGYVLIDRSGKHFEKILNFLREGTVPLPDCRQEVTEILHEAKYYLIRELVNHCNMWLQLISREPSEPRDFPYIPIVQSEEDVDKIVKACSDRPVVEFLMNRQNNKYSYTHQSDENFLRNQEIFDKLVLRTNFLVIFVKNMGNGSSEVCRWKFHGRKRQEICCTSIVYATDRKQMKVDFPEAKIYEEMLNVLLQFGVPSTTIGLGRLSGPAPAQPQPLFHSCASALCQQRQKQQFAQQLGQQQTGDGCCSCGGGGPNYVYQDYHQLAVTNTVTTIDDPSQSGECDGETSFVAEFASNAAICPPSPPSDDAVAGPSMMQNAKPAATAIVSSTCRTAVRTSTRLNSNGSSPSNIPKASTSAAANVHRPPSPKPKPQQPGSGMAVNSHSTSAGGHHAGGLSQNEN